MRNNANRLFVFLLGMALLLGCCGAANAVTPMVSVGDSHALALRSDGTVSAWGSDLYGQLGVGRPLIATSPVMVPGLSKVKAIAAGGAHSLAVRQDGTLWAWGDNTFGQLGDGTTVDRSSPVQVPGITDAVMACGGGAHSAVLKQDGTVWAWGNNWYGQRGDGTRDWNSAPGPVTGLAGVTSIACFGNQTIALLQDGTLRAWGENDYGQLGDGTTTDRLQPVQVSGLNNVAAINGTAALKNDGTVWEWGYTTWSGQPPNLVPVKSAGISGAAALSTSYGGIYGARLETIQLDGVTWWEWTPGTTPSAQAPVGSLKAVASSPFFTLLLKADGTVVASGLNNSGQLGNGITPSGGWDWQSDFLPVVGLANVAAVATGDSHSLALDANGNVWAWGDDTHGQLGRGAILTSTVPTVVPGLSNIVQVSAAAGGSSLAVDASGNVWAWGLNYHGQLGDGTSANRSAPVRVAGVQDIQAVAVGATWTSMALKRDGTVWAWGNNFYGQLANGTTGNYSTTPAQILGLTNVTAIAAHTFHMLAVGQDGTVWAWGGNDNGELGLGTTTPSLVPAQVPGLSGVKSVAASYHRSFAVMADGTAMAWGSGGLGDGTWRWAGQLTPMPVPGLTDVAEISASTYHTLARRSDGSVWGWGTTWGGGSELGSSPRSGTPVPITNLGPMQGISTGQGISGLLGSNGLIYMGGANAVGQLGDGTFAQHPDFVLAVNPTLDGYLNLSTGTTVNVPLALQVPFFVSSTGGISATSAVVKTTTKFNAADVGQSNAVFVTAQVPPGSLVPAQSLMSALGASIVSASGAISPVSSADTAANPFVLIQLTSSGWQPVVNGQLIAYASGVLGDQLAAQTILNGTDTSNLKGAEFCLGYGTSADQMIAAGTMRAVATIPDPNATSAGTATCVVGASVTTTTTTTTLAPTTTTTTTTSTTTTTPTTTSTTTEAATTTTTVTATTTSTMIVGTTTTTQAPTTTTTSTTTTAPTTTSTTLAPTTTTTSTTTTTAPTTTSTAVPTTSTTQTSTTTTTAASPTTTTLVLVTTTTIAPTTTTTASTTTTTLASSPSMHLAPGWNLIGNGIDAALDVATNFGDATNVTTVWKWVSRSGSWAFYAPALAGQGGNALQDYATSKGYEVLTTVNGGEGFWVNAQQEFDITLPDGKAIAASSFQSYLVQGWNLVSIGETRSVRDFNTALGYNMTTLWAWDNAGSAWYFYAPSLDVAGALSGYIASKGYLGFIDANKTLRPGVGFWVNKP
jgi:alpha-tubulin suppressor-like RCC1 family protein